MILIDDDNDFFYFLSEIGHSKTGELITNMWDNLLNLASRDVIGYVTIWIPSTYCLLVLYFNQVSISSRCRHNGKDHDLSGSRKVIDHVIIRFAIGHFLLMVLWNWASYLYRFARYLVWNLELSQTQSCWIVIVYERHTAWLCLWGL